VRVRALDARLAAAELLRELHAAQPVVVVHDDLAVERPLGVDDRLGGDGPTRREHERE
jgi:hypothetical protein